MVFKTNLNIHVSDIVNMVILVVEYHNHTCKWKKLKKKF